MSAGWEETNPQEHLGTLEVEFKKGIYQYSNVPLSEFEELMGASSPGRFMQSNIIGVYDARRL